jgi:maltose alpha-D-glucosyltransferase / alpha-amylase
MGQKPMRLTDLWYENAIVYCLDVETFMDSNGDGIGDFPGLTQRLDYLAGLGVTCIWLMPFFPTPGKDDGYDVTDYYQVDSRLGDLGDFADFLFEAQERGLRVIIDLVVNHTSDQHPWFQEARKGKDSPYYDYYVWREDEPEDTSDQVVFPGEQDGIWSWDDSAKAWYLHHFYDHQPDLNILNSEVRNEIRKIMGFWLELGVAGFRIDAAPFLIGMTGMDGYDKPDDPHIYLKQMRDFVQLRRGDAIFLGEVDVGLSTIADYFGGGNQLHLLFNFIVNRYLFLALAHQTADPLILGLMELPSIPDTGQWVNFLRHHDELNLSRLTAAQREEVFKEFAPKADMQIYDRGLRRRLAPMLNDDRRRLELANSLLFALPGTPVLYYGEEIGMSENLAVEGRLAVRTPMQWTPDKNGGFSSAPAGDLVRPMVTRGKFSYKHRNMSTQRADRTSLLNWLAALIRTRKECPEIGWGDRTIVTADEPGIIALRYDFNGGFVLVIHNLSPEPVDCSLTMPAEDTRRLLDMFSDSDYEPMNSGNPTIHLEGYGYRWLRTGDVGHAV